MFFGEVRMRVFLMAALLAFPQMVFGAEDATIQLADPTLSMGGVGD